MRSRNRTAAAGASREGDNAAADQGAASANEKPGTSTKLTDLVGLLDHAVKQIPRGRLFLGSGRGKRHSSHYQPAQRPQ
jgi:hypothetical protein